MPVFLSKEEIDALGEEIEKERGELFKHEFLPNVRAFPKVRELFERIQADGKRIALASSAKQDELEKYKEIAGIDDLIDDEPPRRTTPRSRSRTPTSSRPRWRSSTASRREAIVVGDTPYDAEAAGKAGLRTIGVLCGGFPRPSSARRGRSKCTTRPTSWRFSDQSPLAKGR